GGDAGEPVVAGDPQADGPAAQAFREIARRILDDVAPPIEMESCTARMLDLVEAALSEHDAAEESAGQG
ncbi:MAG: hypothetical protein OER95_14080, partial [Acidimicrobiia bacterium]|nr:hypothetical protein [Acidimicrobiia bacterium]